MTGKEGGQRTLRNSRGREEKKSGQEKKSSQSAPYHGSQNRDLGRTLAFSVGVFDNRGNGDDRDQIIFCHWMNSFFFIGDNVA